MKKFNKLKYIIFAFICLFIISNSDVKAANDEYICRYKLPVNNSSSSNYYENIRFEIKYNTKTKKVTMGSYNISKKDSYSDNFNLAGDSVHKHFMYGNPSSNEVKTPVFIDVTSKHSFFGYDYAKNGCPKNIYYEIYPIDNNFLPSGWLDNEGESYHLVKNSNELSTRYGDSSGQNCTITGDCGSISLDRENSNDMNISGGSSNIDFKCIYVMGNEEKKGDRLELSGNRSFTQARFLLDDEKDKYVSTSEIDSTKVNNKCPTKLYEISGASESILYLSRPKENDVYYTYYLRTNYSVTDYNPNEQKVNEENISNISKYINTAFNLIRFLVPIIIIVLSVIDFTGVVLSGEEEKMGKAKKNFALRLIVGMLILFVPAILELLLRALGVLGNKESIADLIAKIF